VNFGARRWLQHDAPGEIERFLDRSGSGGRNDDPRFSRGLDGDCDALAAGFLFGVTGFAFGVLVFAFSVTCFGGWLFGLSFSSAAAGKAERKNQCDWREGGMLHSEGVH
jgi:hypothetical protein